MPAENSITRLQKSKSTYLILGGSGFIGARLAESLAGAAHAFRIGDVLKSRSFPDQWRECDVRDQRSVTDLAQGADAIINLAAAHRDDVRPLSLYREINIGGAAAICEAARRGGVRKIIFTSSVAVYGFQPLPVDEDGPFAPFNEYGKTKLEAEGVYRAWADEDPARSLVIVRPAVVFGEGNRGNVYNLLRQIAAGRFFMVGDGKNIKSMAYVGNIAAFLLHTLALGSGTHIFNYVDGPDMDTRSLIEHISRRLRNGRHIPQIPMGVALAGGRVFDLTARITGRTFPISAIRVRKFCESTQFLANRVDSSGFIRPFTLREALDKTIQFEFPSKTSGSSPAFVSGHS
jgi:GlcNAc-P-P-Und epimerase